MRALSLALAVVMGAALALVGAAILSGGSGAGWFAAKTTTDENTIIEQIRLVAKLQTVEYQGAHSVKLQKEDWKGHSRAIYLLEGSVAATVDLQQMSMSVSRNSGQRVVHIKLPEVVVANPVVKRYEILMSCESFLTAPELTDKERNEIHRKALSGLRSAAVRHGIREKALQQAQEYLSTFVGALGYRAEFG